MGGGLRQLPYNTDDSTPPLNNTPPIKAHPEVLVYTFWIFFRPSLHHRGYVECHTPFGRTPETYQTPKYHTRWTPFTHNYARTGMDTGTSMEATAAAHHSGPIEPAARTPPVPAAAAPRARITSFFSGSSPPTGTGTGTAIPAVAQTPTAGTSTGEAQKALAEAPQHFSHRA